MLNRLADTLVMTLAFVILAVGCSSDQEPLAVEVDVQVNVCAGSTCFLAPVPSAMVTIEQSGAKAVGAKTSQNGSVRLQPDSTGTVTIRVSWGGLSSAVETIINPGSQTTTVVVGRVDARP